MILGAGLVLAAALLVCLAAILPLHYALILGAAVVWFTLPGVFIARVIYARQPGARNFIGNVPVWIHSSPSHLIVYGTDTLT